MSKNSDTKKIFKIVAISVFLIFIVIFAFFRSKDLLFGVKIKNVNIIDGQVITESNIIKISGNAKNAKELILNGRAISIDQEGNFNETIALFSGYNIVSIVAKDEFGNIDEKIYKLMH